MNSIIKELKTKPLSGSEIIEACNDEIKVITYNQLLNYKNIDDVFGNKNAVALLYLTHPTYGHWVGLFRYPEINTIEFYDSYGLFIDKQLSFVKEESKKKLGEDYPYLSYLLYNSPYKIIYNDVEVQKKGKEISSCGRHVVMRCISRHIPLDEYIKLLKSNYSIKNPDELVTYLTAFI